MSSEFICIVVLGALYIYQSYRLSNLEKLVIKQLSDVWDCQRVVVDTFDKLVKEIEKIKNEGVENE